MNSTFILKNLKYSINKHIVLLFERHEPNPKPNTIITTNVTAVNIGKHSDSDTEPDYVICALLEPLRHFKLRCTPYSYRTRSTEAMCVRFYLWVFCRGFPVNIVTTLITQRCSSVFALCASLGPPTAQCSLRSIQYIP